jgi:hypothetical protein
MAAVFFAHKAIVVLPVIDELVFASGVSALDTLLAF